MTEEPKRVEPRQVAAVNEPDSKEPVRRIARRFLATPPQPKTDVPKPSQKRAGQAGSLRR